MDIEAIPCNSKFASKGLLRRIADIILASFQQRDVNHVTGDVHFLTYLLNPRKTILTILDCVMMERLRGFPRWIFWALWLWLPEKRCSLIVVISEATRQQVLRHLNCNPNKVRVIYCNVSDDFIPIRKTFADDCPHLLLIGTTPNKNIERVAEALEGLICKVVVIGPLSGSQRQVLAEHCITFESFAGLSRQELLEQYVLCDMVVFASTYEGFGLPIVEANAVGRPVVTSNIWSMPEVAGDSACLVDPFDVADIRAGVLRVIQDSSYREQLVANGFENVKRFQVQKIAAQYAELYREVHKRSQRDTVSR